MTIVYGLWCSADVETTILRGLYFSEAQAEIDREVEHVVRHPTRTDLAAGIVGDYCVTYEHGWCCSIEEIEVRDHAIGVVALPEKPYDAANGLVSEAVMRSLYEGLARRMPFTHIYRGSPDDPPRPYIIIERSADAPHE